MRTSIRVKMMAIEKPQDIAREPPETSEAFGTTSEQDIRQAELSFAKAEELVHAALDGEDDLSEVAWRLTLARWSLGRRDAFRRQWPRQTAIVVAATATTIYLIYRLFWTMNLTSGPAAAFSVALLGAEFYAAVSLGLYFFQVWRLVEPPLRRPTPGQTVDVFVATYNEDVALLRGTLSACLEMDYPHATYILDDGARDEVRQLAESLGVRYISRTDRTHAKAGNLNNALRQSFGDFVVILDADHMPYRHFITRLIGYFDDPQMGFVQAPHTTYNLDNFMGRWKGSSKAYWEDVRIFFEAVQLGKNRFGVACFCGSAAIFRRKAIEDVGLFATETITEDLHTGMRINAAGWTSIAVGEEMVVGLAPDNAATFASQRLRWGEGNLSVLAYDNPVTMKGLTLAGRVNFLASIASWTMGPSRLILYLTPLVMLLTGVAPVADMSVSYFAVVGCYLITVWTAVKVASNGCGQLLGIEMAMMASFHLQLQALWRAMFRRSRQKFVVTSKRRTAKRSGWLLMWPQAALVVGSIVAITWAASRILFGISNDYLCLTIGGGLAAYHAWLALTVVLRAASERAAGGQWRHPLFLAVDYAARNHVMSAVSIEFNENGCGLFTWEPLDAALPLELTFHSPVGETVCHGRVTASSPVGEPKPFAYWNNIVFEGEDVAQRERESDQLSRLILHYVVPVVTMAHQLAGHGSRSLPEELSGEGDFPIPVTIDANLPNLAVQKSVALSITHRGFLAALETPCPAGNVVRVAMTTPLGPIVAEAEVYDVETLQVGTAIVHQHEFRWRGTSPVRQVMSQKNRWKSTLTGTISRLRNYRQPVAKMAAIQLAACLLVAITLFVFSRAYYVDRLLALAARQPVTVAERGNVEAALDRMVDSPNVSVGRLLRLYEAAAAIKDHTRAAEAANRLADRVAKGGLGWMLTSARHLAQTDDHRAADAAFDRVLSERIARDFSPEEQAETYVEAARAALAVGNLDKAVGHFLKASNITTTNAEQAEELLGALIAAKQTKLAIQVLRQLEPSDRVLRQIVDVYEMAKQPEAALLELEELRRRHPEDAGVARRLAELAIARRDFASGLEYYQSLRKLEPENENAKSKVAETMLLLAREDVAAGRFDAARSLFDESFKLQSPDDKVKREYGGLLAQVGRFDEAVAILEPLKDADSERQLAAVLEMQGNRRRALSILLDLEKSHAIEGDDAERSIVRLLLANREYADAADRLVRLIKQSPDDPDLRRELIDAVAASEHSSDALRQTLVGVYQKYRESDFRTLDAEGFERLGDALRRLELLEEACVVFDKAVAVFPQRQGLRFSLAQTLGSLGRYDDAETQYKILLDARPSNLP